MPLPRPARPLLDGVSRLLIAMVVATGAGGVGLSHARAQVGPVYPDDSPASRDSLSRAVELAGAGNYAEAERVIQAVLTSEGERVIASTADEDLFVSVRSRAHDILLADPRLLETYRASEENAARLGLDAGDERTVERARLLTRAGFEAALRLAQEHLEAGRFEAARMTLEQLDRHPDRAAAGRPAQDAAGLALLLARYLARENVRAWAESWAAAAGLPGSGGRPPRAGSPIDLPRAEAPIWPLGPIPSFEPTELVERPLQSVWLSNDAEIEAETARPVDRRRQALGVGVDDSWTFPTVVGDVVYTNDGRSVAAWDRFTLQPLWRLVTRPTDDDAEVTVPGAIQVPGRNAINRRAANRFGNTTVEDADVVTVSGSVVVACTGLTRPDGREGDGRVHAIDARTGRPMWSTSPAFQDPQLAQSYIRGPVIATGDSVIASLRKPSSNKRVAGVHVAALDLWTGQLQWSRLLGSAGSMYPRGQRAGDVPVVDQGVVYTSDDLGIVAALRAHDGSVVWVRRFRADGLGRLDSSPVWSGSGPIIDGDSLIVISPTRAAILRISRRDGALLATRPASDLGDPAYLLPVGAFIACIGTDSASPIVTLVPRDGFESQTVRRVPLVRDARIRGRAVTAQTPEGLRLVIPVNDGVAVIDPDHPDDLRHVKLEYSGNLIALDSHLLVVDRTRLHSFLSWSVTEKLLRGRMEANPADPRPAQTYAALAYRSGHAEHVPRAADTAIDAIARLADAGAGAEFRRSLYSVLLSMVQTTQEQWDGAPAADSKGKAPPIMDLAVLDEIVQRVGRLAESPQEKVQHLMALGRLRDAQALASTGTLATEAGARAVEAYEQILEDTSLASSTWHGPGTATRADLEAGRRVRDLVRRYGRSVCRAFDARAAAELAEIVAAGSEVDALEAMARRYPAAPASLEAWLLSAEAHERSSRTPRALAALATGLDSAEWAASVGDSAGNQIGEFAGRMIRTLQRAEQVSAAAQLLERMERERPSIKLTVRGIEINPTVVAAELGRSLAGLDRRPRLGRTFSGEVQVLEGWAILRPIMQDPPTNATEHVVMISAERREIALFGPQGAGPLQLLWKKPYRAQPPQLVRVDAQSVYLFWPSDEGGELERIAAVGGASRWKTPQFGEMFPPGETDALRSRIVNTPVEGAKHAHDLWLVMDTHTAVLCSYIGRMAAFDLESGQVLWRQVATLSQVYDITFATGVGAGVSQSTLVIGGAAERAGAPGEPTGAEPGVVAYDARSGRLLHHMKTPGGEVRWLRSGPGGEIIAGSEQRIASLNLASGKTTWEVADASAAHTSTAWIFGDRLIVVDPTSGRRMWTATVSGGVRRDEPLDPGPGSGFDERTTRAVVLGDPRSAPIAFCSPRGISVFSAANRLIGRDPWESKIEVIPPEPGDGLFVAVETVRNGTDAGPAVRVHLVEASTGRALATREVVMHEDPRDIALLDGRIVIGTEAVSVVLNLPVGQ